MYYQIYLSISSGLTHHVLLLTEAAAQWERSAESDEANETGEESDTTGDWLVSTLHKWDHAVLSWGTEADIEGEVEEWGLTDRGTVHSRLEL